VFTARLGISDRNVERYGYKYNCEHDCEAAASRATRSCSGSMRISAQPQAMACVAVQTLDTGPPSILGSLRVACRYATAGAFERRGRGTLGPKEQAHDPGQDQDGYDYRNRCGGR